MKTDQLRRILFNYGALRRIVQVLSFILLSAMIFGVGSSSVLLPVLWTWGYEPNIVGDAFAAIQVMLYNSVFPWLALASFLVVGMLIGKSMCGWVCPFGLIQDMIGLVKRKRNDLTQRTHENMIYVKYVLLLLILFISATFAVTKLSGMSGAYERALGIFAKVPFTALSPAETLFAELPQRILSFRLALAEGPVVDALAGFMSLPALFWIQFAIMATVLGFAAYVPRSWCRYFCPHGAIMAILNMFSFIGLRRDPVKCAKGGCRLCINACPMRVPILDLPWEKFSHEECIYCMKCVDACKDKALKLKYL